MTITAKYPGRCAVCGGPIVPGQPIEWEKGKTPTHADCDLSATPQVESPAVVSFTPTSEQRAALDLFTAGDSLAIEAGAGTGKTATLKLLAASTGRRGQYVAFNKAIVGEAGAKMPGTVTCSTAHSLAFRAVGRKYAERLKTSRRMRSTDIAHRLRIDPITVDDPMGGKPKIISASFLGGLAMRAIVRFCQSADLDLSEKHVPFIEGIDAVVDGRRSFTQNRLVARALLPAMKRAWADLMSERGELPFRHDHYLKAWHLSGPRIGADYILFDEAQDANPVMVAIVSAQDHAQLVWVGDSQQQIYTFTGAINALAAVPADGRTFLTQSFRFGPAIAEVANGILERIPAAELRLVGTESIASVVGPVAEPDAILTRTNATAVRTVLYEQTVGGRPALVGGGDDIARFARGAQELMTLGSTDHPDLACFSDWAEVRRYVDEDEQGSELRLNVKLIEDFGVQVILDALNATVQERDATVIVSTAHKSKGREWDAVQLAGDFPEPESGRLSDEELRLLYVASTRARRELDIESVAAIAAPEERSQSAGEGS
jgi:superfamily I DNA/RNA helicase